MARFSGFPKQGLQFLRNLAKNNDREWFQEHKGDFEQYVKAPMTELVLELGEDFESFAPHYLTDPKKAIYRIYRDTRFSNDKTPYKTHVAASFNHKSLVKHAAAGFYFHLSPKELLVGGGVYMPGSSELLAIRRQISADPKRYEKIVTAKPFQRYFGAVTGERLSRPPKGFLAGDPAIEMLKQKQFLASEMLDPELALSPKLLPELSRRFQALAPFIDYLNQPLLG
ncbi:MAG: DUF2461 domain-containing protein [Bryobacterales bacterium]